MPTTAPRPAQGRPPAQAVTSARRSQDEDRGRRMRRYLAAMGVRTVSFPVAVWAFATERYVLATIAAVLATVIPSFAVMLANAVDNRRAPQASGPISPVKRLGPSPAAQAEPGGARTDAEPGAAATPGDAQGGVITGAVVSRRDAADPHRPDEPPRSAAS